jgi:hypothetical protein
MSLNVQQKNQGKHWAIKMRTCNVIRMLCPILLPSTDRYNTPLYLILRANDLLVLPCAISDTRHIIEPRCDYGPVSKTIRVVLSRYMWDSNSSLGGRKMTNNCSLKVSRFYFLMLSVHTWTLHFCTTISHLCNDHKRFYPKNRILITHKKILKIIVKTYVITHN